MTIIRRLTVKQTWNIAEKNDRAKPQRCIKPRWTK